MTTSVSPSGEHQVTLLAYIFIFIMSTPDSSKNYFTCRAFFFAAFYQIPSRRPQWLFIPLVMTPTLFLLFGKLLSIDDTQRAWDCGSNHLPKSIQAMQSKRNSSKAKIKNLGKFKIQSHSSHYINMFARKSNNGS